MRSETEPNSNEGKVKVVATLPQEDIDTLAYIAANRNSTMTEAVRGAIATERFIRDLDAEGATLYIQEPLPVGRVRGIIAKVFPYFGRTRYSSTLKKIILRP